MIENIMNKEDVKRKNEDEEDERKSSVLPEEKTD